MPPRVGGSKPVSMRLPAAIGGVLLLAFIVGRVHPSAVAHSLLALRWTLVLIIALGGISHAVRTWGWRLVLQSHTRATSFLRLAGLRLIAEAGGQLGFVGQIFGDAMRIKMLRDSIPVANLISSVTLDRGLFMIAGTIVSVAGLAAAVFILPLPRWLMLSASVSVALAIALLVFLAIAIRRQFRILSGTARLMSRVPVLASWIEKRRSGIQSVEQQLVSFYSEHPAAFWAAFTLNLSCQVLAVLEVYLILRALGFTHGLFGALFIEALTKLITVAGALNPGNIGTYEGGNILMVKVLGLTPAIGLTLGLTRRLRALFWTAVGSICLIAIGRARKAYDAEKLALAASPGRHEHVPSSARTIAVIVANDTRESVGILRRVGTLPVLLRAILGVCKAGAERIFVLVDEPNASKIEAVLTKTGRVPKSVQWVVTPTGAPLSESLQNILKEVTTNRVIVVSGSRTFHPALFRKAIDWRECDTNVLLNAEKEPVGIYSLSHAFLPKTEFTDFRALHETLVASENLTCLPVEPSLWHRVATVDDCHDAERKLNRWLVKPTDGIFARMNRMVSIPISRQLIRFPITPNMVSLFVLAVSFSSGVFFAHGGYLNTVAGAFLSAIASILDGCDGEVARLKMQDSAFGCWLETVCDYLYYLFIFAGLTVGLIRSSGSTAWLTWGGVLLFGAVMTMLATAFSRHRLAQRRPEDLLRIWQTQAESRKSNPLLFVGRRTEFLARRCFMPYALLVFALLNLTKLVFVLCAVGSNVAWIVSLYSCFVFSSSKGAAAAAPTLATSS